MSDTTIFYLLSSLGVIAHILSVIYKRRPDQPSIGDWFRDTQNRWYFGVTILAAVVFVLVGPGEGADLSSTAVRMNAFAYAGLGAEVIRTSILGPKRMADRKATKHSSDQAPPQP